MSKDYLCSVGTTIFFVTEFTMLILERLFFFFLGGEIVPFLRIISFLLKFTKSFALEDAP